MSSPGSDGTTSTTERKHPPTQQPQRSAPGRREARVAGKRTEPMHGSLCPTCFVEMPLSGGCPSCD